MLNRVLRTGATALLLLCTTTAFAQVVPTPPSIGARSYLLMDFASGHVLVEHNADERAEPASLTKMMTAHAVFEEIVSGQLQLEEETVVSPRARSMPGSRMFVEANSRVTIEALLKGLIVQSGNDASVALAEHIAGGEDAFASLMNVRGAELGLSNTNFRNASGLPDDEHYTTARDMARLAQGLISAHPEYYKWHAIREYVWNDVPQRNRNRLLWSDDSVDGIKTGYTEAAGYCLVASAERDGMRLISVVMGADSEGARIRQSQALLNYGFRFFESHRIYPAQQAVTQARVWKGATKQLDLGLGEDLFVTVPRGQFDNVAVKVDVAPRIEAPVATGAAHGAVSVSLEGEVLAEQPLRALQAVERGGFVRRWTDSVLELVQ